jgi:hypothetical protein
VFKNFSIKDLQSITKVDRKCETKEEVLGLYLLSGNDSSSQVETFLQSKNNVNIRESLERGLYQGKARFNILINDDTLIDKSKDNFRMNDAKMVLIDALK